MQDQFLRLAGHIPHPKIFAAVFALLAVTNLVLKLRDKQPITGYVGALALIAIGLIPVAATTYLHSRGEYHVQLFVARPDDSLVDSASVMSSTGELQMITDGWELDLNKQSRPADSKVAFSAVVKDEFLKGSSTLDLTGDYYPTVTIHLDADTSAKIRGVVVDDKMTAVEGATVTVDGYPESVVTDRKGNFALPAHAGNGQTISLRAQKGQVIKQISAPAGKVVEVILSEE